MNTLMDTTMTTSTLAFIIFSALALQVSIALLIWYVHRKKELKQFHASSILAENSSPPITGWRGFKPFIVQRKQVEDSAKHTCSLYLKSGDFTPLPRFFPGQFLNVKLSIPDPVTGKPKQVIRSYSLSDSPMHDTYRITVKKVPSPKAHPEYPAGLASNYLHSQIQEGDTLLITAPTGNFYLQEASTLPIVFIAGGVGITPILSMLNMLMEQNSPRDIWLFYGVRNGQEQIMATTLKQYAQNHSNFHLYLCHHQPEEHEMLGRDFHHKGNVDITLLRQILPLQRYQFYICGPQPMMNTIIPALENWGVATSDIFYEFFGPASLATPQKNTSQTTQNTTPSSTQKITVYFKKSEQNITWHPEVHSLLELAEEYGIEVDSGCRSGSCGVCQVKLESGEVEYTQPPDIDIEKGYCLLCIAQPKSDITLSA